MEVCFQVGQQRLCRLDQPVEIVPPAMTRQPLLHVAPDALNQIELRRIGGQEEQLERPSVAPPNPWIRVSLRQMM